MTPYEAPPLVWRAWAMPSPETFSSEPILDVLRRWLNGCAVIVDPFARNSKIGTHRNDLNPETRAQWHLDARAYVRELIVSGIEADAVLFDPPYSPRQVSEVYQQIGRVVGQEDTQSGKLYRECRDLLDGMLRPGGIAISCGWNSAGFGEGRGYRLRELLVVAHGGAHNDTLVTVETKRAVLLEQKLFPAEQTLFRVDHSVSAYHLREV